MLSETLSAQRFQPAEKREVLFDEGWKFSRDSTVEAEEASFDDRSWPTVSLPHDYSVDDLPGQQAGQRVGPFSRSSIGATATGFVVGGMGWYRKSFALPGGAKDKVVSIRFAGIYMNADVWLNGHHLGSHPYGYTPFTYVLNEWLRPAGEKNVMVVRVRNNGKNSRWYSGSGIYRHVWLRKTERIFIPEWGVSIRTPKITSTGSTVQISTSLENQTKQPASLFLVTYLFAPDGSKAATIQSRTLLKTNSRDSVVAEGTISKPLRWNVDHPYLYRAKTLVKDDHGHIIDSAETTFGIRSIVWSASDGLLVNGERTLLKGGCIHHDNGPLGAATNDGAEERKIRLLKENGFNAIRTSHNPPSPQLLDACDRLGMMVIDEAFDMWERPKNPDDYHLYFDEWSSKDLSTMVLRDRNHPSVLFWSIGNEINERADTSGLEIARRLVSIVKSLDDTRPVTEAICSFWDHPGRTWEATAPAFALLDVGGYNYQWREYASDHQKYPERIMMGTESIPKEALENWQMVEKYPYVIGDFVWTAFDYMGETAIGHTTLSNQKDSFALGWPWYDAYCGDIDLAGNKKPQSYYRDVVWGRSRISMAVHRPLPEGLTERVSYWGWPDEMQSWNWQGNEGKVMQVRVFSRAPRVQLYLNGKLIGEKAIPDTSITAEFEVPYEAGELKAVATDKKGSATTQLVTTGKAAHIVLTPEKKAVIPGGNDLAYIRVSITDDKGQVVPDAELPVHFDVSGAGVFLAAGSGNPTDMASFHQPVRNTWRGRCVLIVKPTANAGAIHIKATSGGLTTGAASIIVRQ